MQSALNLALLAAGAQSAITVASNTGGIITFADMSANAATTTAIKQTCKFVHTYTMAGDVYKQYIGVEQALTGASFADKALFKAGAAVISQQANTSSKYEAWVFGADANDYASQYFLSTKTTAANIIAELAKSPAVALKVDLAGTTQSGTVASDAYNLVAASSTITRSATTCTFDILLERVTTKTGFTAADSSTATVGCNYSLVAAATDKIEQYTDARVVFSGASATTAFASAVAAAIAVLAF